MVDHGIPWSSDHHFHLGGLCKSSTRAMAIVKATLHRVNRGILRCILIVYYITNQTSTSCKNVLCFDSTYCVPCIHVYSPPMETFKDLYQHDFVLDQNDQRYFLLV